MRRRYLVAYDVADAKRLRHTYRAMHGFGDPVQYSIFLCELSPVERQLMVAKLTALLNLAHDRVMIVDLGVVDGAHSAGIEVIGVPINSLRADYGAVVV